MRWKAWHVPVRLATGAFILNSGLGKRHVPSERAAGLKGMAAVGFPAFEPIEPATFAQALSAGEIAVGAALLAPVVPAGLAGAGLTAFSAGLLRLYWKMPGMRREGSVFPDEGGIALAKDVWMLAIGLALVIDAMSGRRRHGAG